jgi:hypothetical protein
VSDYQEGVRLVSVKILRISENRARVSPSRRSAGAMPKTAWKLAVKWL